MGKLIGYPKDSKTQKGLVFITDNTSDTTDLANVTFDIPTATVAAAVRASPYDNIPYLGFEFRFININPATDGESFGWQLNPVGGSGFDQGIASASNKLYTEETNASSGDMGFHSTIAQEPGDENYQPVVHNIGNISDESMSGFMRIYDTYPLYRSGFYQVGICNNAQDDTYGMWSGGYVLDTERFDEIDFKMSSGNFDGIIRMYGIL